MKRKNRKQPTLHANRINMTYLRKFGSNSCN